MNQINRIKFNFVIQLNERTLGNYKVFKFYPEQGSKEFSTDKKEGKLINQI